MPIVEIAAPFNGTMLTAPTPLMGWISAPGGTLASWTVTVTPLGGGPAIQIAAGSGSIGTSGGQPGQIGIIDASLLVNGAYTLTLTATKTVGLNSSLSQTFSVETDSKLGNFNIGFTDLTVPVAGVPITVRRVYDTLNAQTDGDFGYGWKLDLYTLKLNVDVDAGRGAVPSMGFEDTMGTRPAFREGGRVTITLPDGSKAGFTIFADEITKLNTGSIGDKFAQDFLSEFGGFRSIAFQSDTPGVTLSVTGADRGLVLDSYGQFVDSAGIPYNPFDYQRDLILTTKDGIKYDITGDGKIRTITDVNQNQIVIDSTGVAAISPTGQVVAKLQIIRDPSDSNRITQIIDPANNSIFYHYNNATGDLISMTDRVQATTSYGYGENLPVNVPHILTSIMNPAGVKVLSVGYESDGRVSQITDSSGNGAGLSYTTDVAPVGLPSGYTTEHTGDALGNLAEVVHDDRGNVVRSMKRISDAGTPNPADDPWLVTVYTFNAFNQQTSQSRPFTAIGNARYTTNPDPADFSKWVNVSTFDLSGNLLSSTDSAGIRPPTAATTNSATRAASRMPSAIRRPTPTISTAISARPKMRPAT